MRDYRTGGWGITQNSIKKGKDRADGFPAIICQGMYICKSERWLMTFSSSLIPDFSKQIYVFYCQFTIIDVVIESSQTYRHFIFMLSIYVCKRLPFFNKSGNQFIHFRFLFIRNTNSSSAFTPSSCDSCISMLFPIFMNESLLLIPVSIAILSDRFCPSFCNKPYLLLPSR